MKKTLLFLMAIILQTKVYSQLNNYNDKGKVKLIADKTTLTISGVDAKLKLDQQAAGLALAVGTILPPTIDLVVKSIKEKAKKSALSFKGEYKCSTSGQNFYQNSEFASLPKLTLTRTIKTVKGIDTIAVEIALIPELSIDKTAFRYYIKDKCIYKYSKAKTKGKYDFIDLDIKISFKSISINKEEYLITDLRTTTIQIPSIHVGNTKQLSDTIYSGWIPLPPRSTLKNKNIKPELEEKILIKTDNLGVKETSKEELSIKKSNSNNYEKMTDNTGLYEIEITVTETNPYKIKAENKQTIIESTEESTTSLLKSIIETLTKEKGEDEDSE